uniref:Hyaluronidase n=1 Tax=Strongyloides venezuelensis TaxID=75913 RepID=A0A0K0F6P3_STRVS
MIIKKCVDSQILKNIIYYEGSSRENIVIFYEKNVGLYPYLKYINSIHNEYFNGGIPQNTNISVYIFKLRQDISKKIPNPDFDGIAVINVEEWRPTHDSN